MKLLRDILYKVSLLEVHGTTDRTLAAIEIDSRKVEAGCLFVAVKGARVDGHNFIKQAEAAGASAIICEQLPEKLDVAITYIKVSDSSKALGWVASNFYDNPSEELTLVGITGTNGKTTVATLLFKLYKSLGYACGLISTVQNQINDTVIAATHTTPDAISINKLLRDMVDLGCSHCFMEVSSHAASQNRIEGLQFKSAAFTNLTHDHLDYHQTFANYLAAKKSFFDRLNADAIALVNRDDKNGLVMVQNCKASIHTYALSHEADFKAKILENGLAGLNLTLDGHDFHSPLIGAFNAANLLAVYGIAVLLGENNLEVLTKLSGLQTVSGRFEYVKAKNGLTGIVDFAHTPDALQNVLETITQLKGAAQVITVVGCGGDRDTTKRPIMAEIACKYSDKVVLTSDNPRSEDPYEILKQMQSGVPIHQQMKVLSIENRKEAIRTATMLATPADIILVAGKGHENYQEIKGVKHHFSDMETIKEVFKNLNL